MTHPSARMTRAVLRADPHVYTIPAGSDFAGELARGVMTRHGGAPDALPACRIFLPTRRACRVVRDAFLRRTGGAPLLLPRLQPLGDVDADEVAVQFGAAQTLDLPGALSPLRRQILLTRILLSQPEGLAKTPEQAVALAGALGDLLDRIQTEGLDIRDLKGLVSQEFADHWQITLDFLKILAEHWPAILMAEGAMDPAARRDALTRVMTRLWRDDPPTGPVIAAGSTGSIPATAEFLEIIARLPQGCVILPGLDRDMDDASWEAIDDSHPQAALKTLLTRMVLNRAQVRVWGPEGHAGREPGHDPQGGGSNKIHNYSPILPDARRSLAREVMRPAGASGVWKMLGAEGGRADDLKGGWDHLYRHDCDTPQEEAGVIAAIFRETLEDGARTAALVTPDRVLARRVVALSRRWGILVDDSGGSPLDATPPARFLRLTLRAALETFAPVPLSALLRHALCAVGLEGGAFRHGVRGLDRFVLRGLRPAPGFSGLRARLAERRAEFPKLEPGLTRIETLLTRLERAFDPLVRLLAQGTGHAFADWLEAHVRTAEALASGGSSTGAERLWSGEAGAQAAAFLSEIRESASLFPPLTGPAYEGILEMLMRPVTVRPAWGMHPRLTILGQIEARMVAADVVILGGLNEGTWPADPGHDPWMSRPMRAAFGLPSPERAVGFAAQDFVQGFCAPTVHLTRAARAQGAPTVPARWLQRLDVVMQALGHDPAVIRTQRWKSYVKFMDRPDRVQPVTRPAPCPPVERRPHRISVTRVETLLTDPYSLYAREVLRLRALEPLDKIPDEADRGTILHAVLEGFVRAFPDTLPPDARDWIMDRARAEMDRRSADPAVWSVWLRRMERIATAFVAQERARRPGMRPVRTEARGESIFRILDRDVTLSAIADRIDRTPSGGLEIIDYKSGGAYTAGRIRSGDLVQLPLEALLVHRGGFEGLTGSVESLSYWKMTGRADEPLDTISLPDGEDGVSLAALAQEAGEGFEALMAAFLDPATPYYSLPRLDRRPRYNDYEHLARVSEWSAPGDLGEVV